MNKRNLRNVLIALIVLAALLIYPFRGQLRHLLSGPGETEASPARTALCWERADGRAYPI